MKRFTVFASIISGFLLFGAQNALAALDPGCTALGGVDGTGTCLVTGAHSVTGTITVAEPLILQPTAKLTVTGTSLTLNVTVGSLEMDINSAILGGGRNITVNVPNGDMTMEGTAGALGDKCGYPSPNPALGAQITSTPATLLTTITINVGNYPNSVSPTGSFFMERCSLVSASTGGNSAGTVIIKAGRETDLDGLVLSESTLSGTGINQAPGGGPITVQSGCKLTVSSTGVVSSKGSDPGADLVHLEGCDVVIDGLVQSTGPGHATPKNPANHCATGVHSGKNPDSTGCVEIIGQNITISNTGEVNANVNSSGSGGTSGTSWIDLYAYDDFFLTGRTAALASFLVHANSLSGSDNTPNTITVVAQNGGLTGSGKLFQASDTGNGSDGGTVNITTMKAINLVGNTPTILAQGHNGAGGPPCLGGSGNCGKGGFINLQSFSSSINWLAGSGNVEPDVGASPPAGKITLTACTGVTTTLTSFGNTVLGVNRFVIAACPGGTPPVPAYIQAAFDVGDPIWDACAPFFAKKSGMKFKDVDKSGSFTLGDTPIEGWPINLLTTANVLITTVNTDVNGKYKFDSIFTAPGTFRVCEGAGPAGYTQTFPHAGNVHVGETIINKCPAPNIWGYEFTIVNGSNFTDDDFGNAVIPPPQCPEDINAVLTRSVSKDLGGGLPFHATLQAAYDAALVSGIANEVIGMFGNTKENVTLGGTKTLKITQCTSARITASDGTKPVWNITSTGKLTIQGPDSVGGTIGWWVHNASGGPHTLKSVRANGASQYGILIGSNGNEVSWNDASGNGPGAGVRVTGNSNTLRGGDTGPNSGDGVQLVGNSNTLSGATIESNSANGVVVTGSSNEIKGNKANLNTLDGFNNAAGAGNKYSGNGSNAGGENGGAEYRFVTAGVNGGSNRADGVNVPSAAKCPNFATAGSVCE